MASKIEIHRVAEVIHRLIDHIYNRYAELYFKQNGSFDRMLTFGDYVRDRIHGAGQSLGGQILGALGHRMLRNDKVFMRGKLGVIYGLDAAGVEFSKRGEHNQSVDDFFHLDRTHAHRVINLITDSMESGSKYAEGHYNYYVNGPIRGLDGYQAQPGCNIEGQRPSSCSHQRAMNLFRASLKHYNDGDNDNLLIGFKYERVSRQGRSGKYSFPYNSGTFKLVREKTSVYGLNNNYGGQFPNENAEPEIYFLPTAPCSPFNYMQNKVTMKLPEDCTELTDNEYEYDFWAWTPTPVREMSFYEFSQTKVKG